MAIITLTTDLGLKDSYVGSIKGAILKELPSVSIVDISHQISKFDITEAAFVLRTAFHDFPEGTVHIIGVNTEATLTTPHVVVQYRNQYFVGSDNGIFSLIFDANPDKVGNIRDYAFVSQLVCLTNLESHNAEFIRQGLPQAERLLKLNEIAIIQIKSLLGTVALDN